MTQGSAEDNGHSTVETQHALHYSNSRVQSVCIVACTVQHSMTKHVCSGKAFAPRYICKYIQRNGIMQHVMYKEVQPLLKLQLKLAEASDRLAVSKVIDHPYLKHLHNVGTRFHCPQTFLSLDSQFMDDVFELN